MILSASRRTDIPAFYADWFLEHLRTGSFTLCNPFNPKQVRMIEISPARVECIVFWSKNPVPLLPLLPEMDAMGYSYYFQFTLTPYGPDIERNLPPKTELVRLFQDLARLIGREKVVWRYDPILFTPALDPDWHVARFQELAKQLGPFTEQCVVSFLDFYRKTEKNTAHLGLIHPDESMVRTVCEAFRAIADHYNLALRSCCEELACYGIASGACIDAERIARITGKMPQCGKDKFQRRLCNCAASVDVGRYNTCSNGCVYCYANTKTPQ